MRDQTQSLSVNRILRDEHDCLLGLGQDPGSQFCADTIARVVRSGAANHLASVHAGYVNIGMERTSGLAASATYTPEHAAAPFPSIGPTPRRASVCQYGC